MNSFCYGFNKAKWYKKGGFHVYVRVIILSILLIGLISHEPGVKEIFAWMRENTVIKLGEECSMAAEGTRMTSSRNHDVTANIHVIAPGTKNRVSASSWMILANSLCPTYEMSSAVS